MQSSVWMSWYGPCAWALDASEHNKGQIWGQGSAGGTNNTNCILSSRRAASLGQPWHSTPRKDADFVHGLQRESMSTSLLLPRRLHQGVRRIQKETHANRTAPCRKRALVIKRRNSWRNIKDLLTNLDTKSWAVICTGLWWYWACFTSSKGLPCYWCLIEKDQHKLTWAVIY